MASHGVPRYRAVGEISAKSRQDELRNIKEYRELEGLVHEKISRHETTPEALQMTTKLLSKNPEYYTIWNYRRSILQYQFSHLKSSSLEQPTIGQIAGMIKADLQFLLPLLRKLPKCYWIWNHRHWLLENANRLLPIPIAYRFWQEELALASKMLSLDSRNFHGWDYRQSVVNVLKAFTSQATGESSTNDKGTTTQNEFDYTTKMIGTNLSNFSAWHSRIKLIQKLLNERNATDAERKKMLDNELELIHNALIDPYDQSLWFYHQNLMCTFNPTLSAQTMAPNLSDSECLGYIQTETNAIEDILEVAEDCKWVYQALINCAVLESKIRGVLSRDGKRRVLTWLDELIRLDPMRRGRWLDFKASFDD